MKIGENREEGPKKKWTEVIRRDMRTCGVDKVTVLRTRRSGTPIADSICVR